MNSRDQANVIRELSFIIEASKVAQFSEHGRRKIATNARNRFEQVVIFMMMFTAPGPQLISNSQVLLIEHPEDPKFTQQTAFSRSTGPLKIIKPIKESMTPVWVIKVVGYSYTSIEQ